MSLGDMQGTLIAVGGLVGLVLGRGGVFMLWRRARARRWTGAACFWCGYAIDEHPVCPECGRATADYLKLTDSAIGRRAWTLVLAGIACVALGVGGAVALSQLPTRVVIDLYARDASKRDSFASLLWSRIGRGELREHDWQLLQRRALQEAAAPRSQEAFEFSWLFLRDAASRPVSREWAWGQWSGEPKTAGPWAGTESLWSDALREGFRRPARRAALINIANELTDRVTGASDQVLQVRLSESRAWHVLSANGSSEACMLASLGGESPNVFRVLISTLETGAPMRQCDAALALASFPSLPEAVREALSKWCEEVASTKGLHPPDHCFSMSSRAVPEMPRLPEPNRGSTPIATPLLSVFSVFLMQPGATECDALQSVHERLLHMKWAGDRLLRLSAQSSDVSTREIALAALKQRVRDGRPESVQTIRGMLEDPDRAIRLAAALALVTGDDAPKALDVLLAAAVEDEQERLAWLAQANLHLNWRRHARLPIPSTPEALVLLARTDGPAGAAARRMVLAHWSRSSSTSDGIPPPEGRETSPQQ